MTWTPILTSPIWLALVAVTVTSNDPAVDPDIVQVELSPSRMTVGAHAAVTPEGSDVAASATLPWKPFCPARLTVDVALPPARNETLHGYAERENVGPVPD